jgi:serine/threonine-protein kinase HipA
MEQLTIQAFLEEDWVDMALLTFPESDADNWHITELEYLSDYAIEFLDRDDAFAVSANNRSLLAI